MGAFFFFLINAHGSLAQSYLADCNFQEEVRKLAVKFGLANKDRKDSQGICFLGKVCIECFFALMY